MPADDAIRDYLRAHRDAETRFLAEIVKVPSDNPPGDCDHAAETVAKLLEGLGFVVERHKVPDALVKANGMISATNLIVRKAFGRGGPTDRAERAWRRRAAGNRLDPRPLRRGDRRRLDGRARSGGVEVGHRHLRLRDAGAGKERRGAKRNGRTARHLRRGGRRRDRAALASGRGADEAGPRDRRRILLRGRHRPQRLPASGGRGSGPLRPRRPSVHRRRRARGGQCNPDRALRLARRSRRAGVQAFPASARRR